MTVATPKHKPRERLSVGIKALDEMLGGGIPAGYSVLLAGPSGSGKSVLATQFISGGAHQDEPGIIAVFEKRPTQYSQDDSSALRFAHCKDLRAFEIADEGIVMGETLGGYEGLLTALRS